ncbi:MAG: HYR domain-containing protein [Bacteroidota bacterium]|nr:HYR domain-containing protein [Bacteroidota bacterium]
MKKIIPAIFFFAGLSLKISAQCLTLSCPGNVSASNTPGNCNTVVTYSTPAYTSSCAAPINDTFFYTGAMQTYVVPAGVTTLTLQTWGAQGGANWVNNVNYGGYTKADFAVTPGETLYIFAGGQPSTITGGFNGGGNGEGAGKGGGGASDVRQGGSALTDRIIVAGGAGGAGYWSNVHVVGGPGGGLTGGNGYRDPSYAANPGGQGATQSASGTGTCVSFNNPSVSGGFGYGGVPSGCGCEGYGGGGGWYGGAGSGNCRGGGGGSSYVLPAATNTTITQGGTIGNGKVVVSYNGPAPVTSLVQTTGLPSGSNFPVGVTTNAFTATDTYGNTASCSFNVTVSDIEAPVVSTLSNIAMNNDAGQCGAVVTWTAPVITDNCSANISSTQSHNSGDFFPAGNTTVTYTITDGTNVVTTTFTVTITDTEAPSISSMPSVTVNNDAGQCGAVVTWTAPVITDNCGTPVTTQSHNSGDFFPIGNTTVNYTSTDGVNSSTVSFTVTVMDAESPVISNLPAVTVNNDAGQCGAIVTWTAPTVTDNCTAMLTITQSHNSGDFFPIGSTTVTYTVTDGINTTTSPFIVTVTDAEAPVISGCPPNITACEGVVTFGNAPTATDNCSATVTQISGPLSGDNLVAGTYTVGYVATDAAGNTDSCQFTITVNADPVVTLDLGVQSVVCVDDASFTLAGASPAGGTWSGNGVSGSSFDPGVAGSGTQSISYLYVDANGCEASAMDTIQVNLCTGITEQGATVFSMYPNPASGYFTFTTTENGTLAIIDVEGKLVKTEQIVSNRQEINLRGIATGTYLVRFISVKGEVSTGKLLIQE